MSSVPFALNLFTQAVVFPIAQGFSRSDEGQIMAPERAIVLAWLPCIEFTPNQGEGERQTIATE